MNEQRVSDEQLSCLVDPCWLGEPVTATQYATRMALIELQQYRSQRCETCGNSAETLGPPFDSVGCKEHHGWWPKSGYCHLWKGGTDDEAGA